jgi:hypothetical protein
MATGEAVSRLTALIPAVVCAKALGRPWPEDLDGQVRCIDEGTRALGLAHCCAPWSVEAEDAALRSELGAGAGVEPGFGPLDAVAAGLADSPSAPPVLGLVSGPLAWIARLAAGAEGRLEGPDAADALDAASDLATARVGALVANGVSRVAVVEDVRDDTRSDDGLAGDSHEPIIRAAAHLRVDLLLVTGGADTGWSATLGYRQWASASGCSEGLALVAADVFESATMLEQCLARHRAAPDLDEIVIAPLDDGVSPALLHHASRILSGEVARP